MMQQATLMKSSVWSQNRTQPSVLIGVGNDHTKQYGIRFVRDFFCQDELAKFTLFHLQNAKTLQLPGTDERSVSAKETVAEEFLARTGEQLSCLVTAQASLKQVGISSNRLALLSRLQTHSKAWDLMDEAANGNHDALVLGKRGKSWFESMINGSTDITKEVIEQSCARPIWLAPSSIHGRRNVLLCVDGSRSSRNITEHVAQMVASNPMHTITVLHVAPGKKYTTASPSVAFLNKQSRNQRKAQCFISKTSHQVVADAVALLVANGVEESVIRTQLTHSNDPASVIMETSDQGNFAVVAMGRSGTGNSFMRHMLMGSSVAHVWKKLDNACLWLSC